MNVRTGRGPVLVGVSRNLATVWAVRWAADEAAARGLPLRIVHAQEWPSAISPESVPGAAGHLWASHFRAAGQALVDTARVEALRLHPQLDVSVAVAEGKPHEVLRTLGADASQVVLGTRRLSDVESAFVRSRGAGLFGRVRCPVVLVPQPEEPQPDHGAPRAGGLPGGVGAALVTRLFGRTGGPCRVISRDGPDGPGGPGRSALPSAWAAECDCTTW